MKTYIAASILSSDFAQLKNECESVLESGCDWLHIDIMDGHYVPNISIGPCVVECIRKALPNAFLDCHLMVLKPEQWVNALIKSSINMFTFHIETVDTIDVVIQMCKIIKNNNIMVGIALHPNTKVEAIYPFLNNNIADMVLIMTVIPGFGGQKFMTDQLKKIKVIREKYPNIIIEVDGGIDNETAKIAVEYGANVFVSGSYIFNSHNRVEAIRNLREAISGQN